MIRIAIQAKGRLNEESIALLKEAGISIEDSKRKLLAKSEDFRSRCSTCATMTFRRRSPWA